MLNTTNMPGIGNSAPTRTMAPQSSLETQNYDRDQAKKAGGRVTKDAKSSTFSDIGLMHKEKNKEKNDASEIGDFMRLFLAQINNQDPTSPQEGADFVAQLAQFNMVETMQKNNSAINKMADTLSADRVLGATAMLGKSIDVPTDRMLLRVSEGEDGSREHNVIEGKITMPWVHEHLGIKDAKDMEKIKPITEMLITVKKLGSDEVIQQYPLAGEWKSGSEVDLQWNGKLSDGTPVKDRAGNPISAGEYRIRAQVSIGNKWVDAPTTISTQVDSVNIDQRSGEILLNARSLGSVRLGDLRKIGQSNIDTSSVTADKLNKAIKQVTQDQPDLASTETETEVK